MLGPACGCASDSEARKKRFKLSDLDWLNEMGDEAGLLRTVAIFVLAPAGDGDQRDAGACRQFTNLGRGFQSVHAGHSQIEQHHAGKEAGDFAEGSSTVMSDANFVAGEIQQSAEAIGGVGVVIDDQDSGRVGRGGAFSLVQAHSRYHKMQRGAARYPSSTTFGTAEDKSSRPSLVVKPVDDDVLNHGCPQCCKASGCRPVICQV